MSEINPIESLLNQVNRLFEEDLGYQPAGSIGFIPTRGTRETIETAEYSADGAPQSWRQVAFSFDRADLIDRHGEQITPRRGDRIKAKDGTYRLIEWGGLAFTPRFDAGFDQRILVYFEKEAAGGAD